MPERPRIGLSLRFVNAHYAPDVAATGEFLTDLAEELVRRGHRVHVVTGSAAYRADELRAPEEEVRNGVRITRVRTPAAGKGTVDRLAGYGAFLAAAAPVALGGTPVDLTVYLTTPPMVGLLGLWGRILVRRPYGLWVMDLHPEAEVAHGMISPNGMAARLLERMDRAVFRRSSFTAVLGRCMAERVGEKATGSTPPAVLPLWKDIDEVAPLPRSENPLARAWDIGDRFVLMYSGNAGLAHRFQEVKALLRHYREDDGVLTLFIGDGPRRREIEAFLAAEDIPNARYLDYVPRDQTRWTLPLADVHLVTLEPEWCGIAVPSKIFGIMASGRATAMVSPPDAEPARIVAETESGVVVDPGEADAERHLIEAVEALRADPIQREQQGRRARAALLDRYSREAGVDRWERALLEALGLS